MQCAAPRERYPRVKTTESRTDGCRLVCEGFAYPEKCNLHGAKGYPLAPRAGIPRAYASDIRKGILTDASQVSSHSRLPPDHRIQPSPIGGIILA